MRECLAPPDAGRRARGKVNGHRVDPAPVIAKQILATARIQRVIACPQDEPFVTVTAQNCIVHHRAAQFDFNGVLPGDGIRAAQGIVDCPSGQVDIITDSAVCEICVQVDPYDTPGARTKVKCVVAASTVQSNPATLDLSDVEDIILGVRIGAEIYVVRALHAQQCGGAI